MNATFTRRTAPPSLPPLPTNLTPAQLKRRQIVSAIVHNENSYVSTLQRLVNVSTRQILVHIGNTNQSIRFFYFQSIIYIEYLIYRGPQVKCDVLQRSLVRKFLTAGAAV